MRILNHLHHNHQFNSTRKRMSAIVKYPDGKIVLFCKGADSVIYERLEDERPELQDFTSRHMDAFAQDGNLLKVFGFLRVKTNPYLLL